MELWNLGGGGGVCFMSFGLVLAYGKKKTHSDQDYGLYI